MIPVSSLQDILADNRRLVRQLKLFPRNVTVPKLTAYVAVGIRRCGKSYWLFQIMQQLAREGVPWTDLLYVNFESEQLLGFDVTDFNRILEAHAAAAPQSANPPVLFLDEVQNISHWEKFARRMADQKIATYLTGSNARLLGKDVASTLGGRFFSVNMFTFSFREMLQASGIETDGEAIRSTEGRGRVQGAFQSFLQCGGFPETLGATDEEKLAYLADIYRTIYLGDVVARNRIANPFALRLLLLKTAESVGQPLSYSRLASLVEQTGAKLSKVSVISHLNACCDACLLYAVSNYHGKLVERQTHPKFYFADNGILRLLRRDPASALLENLVALTLLRRHGLQDAVFYFEHNVEVDFYVPAEETAVQVCFTLAGNPATKEREVGALEKFSAYLPCRRRLILTLEEEGALESSAGPVEVLPVWKWLLQEMPF